MSTEQTAPGQWDDFEYHEFWTRFYMRASPKTGNGVHSHPDIMEHLGRAQINASLAVAARLGGVVDRLDALPLGELGRHVQEINHRLERRMPG